LFFGREHIVLEQNVRIDAYAVVTASQHGVRFGEFSHLGVGAQVFGTHGRVEIGRAVGIGPRVSIFTGSDDYTGGHLGSPALPHFDVIGDVDDHRLWFDRGAGSPWAPSLWSSVTWSRTRSSAARISVSSAIATPTGSSLCWNPWHERPAGDLPLRASATV
jgi:hypothetical protein